MATDDINDPRFSEATGKILRALTTPPVPEEGRILLLSFESEAAAFEKLRAIFNQVEEISRRVQGGVPPDVEAELQARMKQLLAVARKEQARGEVASQQFAALATRLGVPECA